MLLRRLRLQSVYQLFHSGRNAYFADSNRRAVRAVTAGSKCNPLHLVLCGSKSATSAGRGSHGAVGGEGGNVTIYVDEDRLHLLLAVSWDVRGGLGGAEGNHGQPGIGGAGGAGGRCFVWYVPLEKHVIQPLTEIREEHVDNKYRCTANCIGKATSLASRNRQDPMSDSQGTAVRLTTDLFAEP